MKLRLFLIMAFIIIVTASCTNKALNDDNTPKENGNTLINESLKIEKNQNSLKQINNIDNSFEQVEELINHYEKRIVEAINSNNFSLVEPYLAERSPLFESQKKLVGDLYSKGIKEEYVAHDFGYTYYISDGIYKVQVVETIKIKYPKKDETEKEFQWIYTANNADKTMKLTQIEKWKDFDKDIEKLEGSVKADGYYADEVLYEEYDAALINKLNDDNSDELENMLGRDAMRKQIDLLCNLRDKGHSYDLIDSEVIEYPNREIYSFPYEAKKKLKLSYIDRNSNKKELNLIVTLVLEEHRTGYNGLFGGYCQIIDIKDIIIE